MSDDLRELQVTEVVRQGGKLWFTLHHTYVGSEYNHHEDILLNEEDARALLAELRDALDH